MDTQTICIFTIPLKSKNDYDVIDYASEYQLSETEQFSISEIIEQFKNSRDMEGQKIINTSLGEIKITHEPHPVGDRRKLIQGFLLEAVPVKADIQKETSPITQIMDLLQQLSPTWIMNNPKASQYLQLVHEEINAGQLSDQSFKELAFFAILKLVSEQLSNDIGSQTRLNNLIANLKTLSPNNPTL